MSEPLVVAILLTRDRPEMAKRAVECFRAQTYGHKRLYIYDTGATPCTDSLPDGFPDFNIVYYRDHWGHERTIGALRNEANWWAVRRSSIEEPDAEIIMHADDDDISHPNRITEQVAHLQSSGADVVGYREMLFWREYEWVGKRSDNFPEPGEAWLYTHRHRPLGTSLMYWRKTWEAKKFADVNESEDTQFCQGLKVEAVSALHGERQFEQPRMVARIHSGNTSKSYNIEDAIARGSREWKRVPQWDDYCRKVFA